jgi:chemotaxis protein CheD
MAITEIELPMVYLQPGEVHLARSPAIVRTVLGSCVGVTFWSSRLGIGALCHGVLPRSPQSTTLIDGYRYVDFSIRDLARQFDRLGARRDEIEIKVFGGADVLPVHPSNTARTTVGSQNSQVALEVLQEECLAILASDLGGPVGRTIQFHTGNGEVLLRRLSRQSGNPW